MNPFVLLVDDEPDVEVLFRQQFRRDLRAGRLHHGVCPVRSGRTSTDRGRGRGVNHLLVLSNITCRLELLPKAGGHAEASR
jgi:hypothetical protein